MSFMKTAALVGSMATAALAHGTITALNIDGVDYEAEDHYSKVPGGSVMWWADNGDNGFVGVPEYGTSDISCHKKATPGQKVAPIAAGGKIALKWMQEGSDWPASHHGPVIDYMAKCAGDCADADPASLKWFKIAERGLISGAGESGTWASDELIAAGNKWDITVPETLAAGQYVVRHEIIGLHSAQNGEPQNYPQCFNVEVSGSGTASPEGTGFQTLYEASMPGLKNSIYDPSVTPETYKIPGPALWDGASSGSSPAKPDTPAASPSATAPAATSPAATDSYEAPAATSSDSYEAPATTVPAVPSAAPTGGAGPYGNSTTPTTEQPTYPVNEDNEDSPEQPEQPQQPEQSETPEKPQESETPKQPEESEDKPQLPESYKPVQKGNEHSNRPSKPTDDKPVETVDESESETSPETPAAYGETEKPAKELPAGWSLQDLLDTCNYYISKGWNADGIHARDFSSRR